MQKNRFVKQLFAALILLLLSTPMFAIEEYVSNVYKEIDSAFSQKSDSELNVVLKSNRGDKYYFLMENYATKKVRRLIITNDYEFAMDAIIVIIDNNLENTDAVEMYATIADAYELQKQMELQEIERQKREQERVAALKEGQRSSAEKEYVSLKNVEGKTVFSTGKDGKLTYSGWQFDFGINPMLISNDSDKSNSLFLGVTIDGQFYTQKNNIVFGGDLFGNFHFLNIKSFAVNKDNSMYSQIELFPKMAFAKVSKNLFFKVGFVGILPIKPADKSNSVAETLGVFLTPAIGVDIANLKLGSMLFTAGMDYYPGHLWTPDLNFAMGAKANFAFDIGKTELIALTFNLGVRDILYIKNGGIENRLNLILALGVHNVTK